MADEVVPGPGGRPRSRGSEFRLRLITWVSQIWYWDERPSPGLYRAALEQRDAALARNRTLETKLAIAQAQADAAEAEIEILSAVVERNRERVHAEVAKAAADRETHINKAASAKADRGDD